MIKLHILNKNNGKIFAVMGCYAAYTCIYRRFGTTYLSHIQGSSSPRSPKRRKTFIFLFRFKPVNVLTVLCGSGGNVVSLLGYN
jgi:hypothetical protein